MSGSCPAGLGPFARIFRLRVRAGVKSRSFGTKQLVYVLEAWGAFRFLSFRHHRQTASPPPKTHGNMGFVRPELRVVCIRGTRVEHG